MAFLGLVDTKEVEAFATTLAEDLGRRFPPASEKRTDAGAKNQLGVILEGLGTRAVRFRDEKQLGLYKKAKLGNVFRWKLKDLGYSDAFVDHATTSIVTRVAVK
ncbi:MAG TPA: hypothetical protein VFQ55_05590 [Casimicrobiaceae bacterium]|jgi:hypothetical protein|nr:hypothetical protein [Casimicrobiaceae bacterium]